LAGQLRVTRIQIGIVQMTLEHALLEAVGHGHVRDAAIEGEHAPMRTEVALCESPRLADALAERLSDG
jgi:hypothetical protein